MRIMKNFYKIKKKLTNLILGKFFNYEIPLVEQNARFSELNLLREEGLKKLNQILLENFDETYDETKGMFSEHLILLSAISLSNRKISSILEIGTYDGKTALILSKLFPNSVIDTIDLPDNSDEFITTYDRTGQANQFIESRDLNLGKSENIFFKKTNSLNLINSSSNYDLLWIDGAHGYPVVAFDILNSLRLTKPGSIVMIDDIWKTINKSDRYYRSTAGYECLCSIKDVGLIKNFYLIPKRIGSVFNQPNSKKFIGFFIR